MHKWASTSAVAGFVLLAFLSPRADAAFRFRMSLPPAASRALTRTTPVTTSSVMTTPVTTNVVSTPSLAAQSINPNFRLTPNLTVSQAAFNTTVLGQALRQVPPFAFGNLGGNLGFSQLAGFGTGYMMGGYGYAPMYGGGGYGGGQLMASPYSSPSPYTADLYSGSQAASYPAISTAGDVSDARLVTPATTSNLVSSTLPDKPTTTRDVWIHDNFFSPGTIWVPAGTTVRWINYGYEQHSVVSLAGSWDSGAMRHGAEFSITFNQPGTFRYACRYHSGEMVAEVIVSK
jgi:plastocyanin